MGAVRRYDILDTPPDGAFDRITAMASRLFDVPISIVSLVDTDRIWFKSHHGLEVEEIDREPGLCASAILHEGPWLVSDAAHDPRTLANPLVAGEFGLRFYAGVPLTTHDGYNLGTLCVIDKEPRQASDDEMDLLADLASVVMDEIELRLAARRTLQLEGELREQAESVARSLQETLLPRELPEIAGLELTARFHVAALDTVGGDFYDVVAKEGGCLAVVGDACGKGSKAAAITGAARWGLRALSLDSEDEPGETLAKLNNVLTQVREAPETYCTMALASIRPRKSGGADVTVALGGHPYCLVLRGDGSVERIGETAGIIGWFSDMSYPDCQTSLASGESLLLFTDGLLEALAPRESTDDSKVQGLLEGAPRTSATAIADTIDSWLGSDALDDDAAFLVVRVL